MDNIEANHLSLCFIEKPQLDECSIQGQTYSRPVQDMLFSPSRSTRLTKVSPVPCRQLSPGVSLYVLIGGSPAPGPPRCYAGISPIHRCSTMLTIKGWFPLVLPILMDLSVLLKERSCLLLSIIQMKCFIQIYRHSTWSFGDSPGHWVLTAVATSICAADRQSTCELTTPSAIPCCKGILEERGIPFTLRTE